MCVFSRSDWVLERTARAPGRDHNKWSSRVLNVLAVKDLTSFVDRRLGSMCAGRHAMIPCSAFPWILWVKSPNLQQKKTLDHRSNWKGNSIFHTCLRYALWVPRLVISFSLFSLEEWNLQEIFQFAGMSGKMLQSCTNHRINSRLDPPMKGSGLKLKLC